MLGEAVLHLLREDDLCVAEDVELALPAGLDLGLVLGLGVQLGRETRGPFVVAVSDGAILNQDPGHAENVAESHLQSPPEPGSARREAQLRRGDV